MTKPKVPHDQAGDLLNNPIGLQQLLCAPPRDPNAVEAHTTYHKSHMIMK